MALLFSLSHLTTLVLPLEPRACLLLEKPLMFRPWSGVGNCFSRQRHLTCLDGGNAPGLMKGILLVYWFLQMSDIPQMS